MFWDIILSKGGSGMRIADEVDVFGLFQLDSNNFEYNEFLTNYSYMLAEASTSEFDWCTDLLFLSSVVTSIENYQRSTFECSEITDTELNSYVMLKYQQVSHMPINYLQPIDQLFVETFLCQQNLEKLYSTEFTQDLVGAMYRTVYQAEQISAISPRQKIMH